MTALGLPDVLSGYADLEIPAVEPWATAAGYTAHGYGVLMTRPLADPIPGTQLPAGLGQPRYRKPVDVSAGAGRS